jgi:hypothetical protein
VKLNPKILMTGLLEGVICCMTMLNTPLPSTKIKCLTGYVLSVKSINWTTEKKVKT